MIQYVQLGATALVIVLLIVVYKEVRSLDPEIRAIGKTAGTANGFLSFLGL
jgi:hypothetical protein